jgi:NOL1/NOP2/sun family putative RNA methylase
VTHIFPTEYQRIIQDLLQEESAAFWKAANDSPLVGLRINSLKENHEAVLPRLPGHFQQLPWTKNGYQIIEGIDLGKNSFHLAGLYYLQEPSAMVPVEILDPQPGEKILDLCAAPGGKTTQIISKMNDRGWLLANDPNPRRIQALLRNVDRWGARNIGVSCETPSRLASRFGDLFDRVLIDAPCSGEGTFRSDPGAVKKWSPRFMERCAQIQDEILWFGAKMVRPGGVLVYSTCTFNRLENEGTLERFLGKNPEYSLEAGPHLEGTQPGISLVTGAKSDFSEAVRIWPHRAPGEGHFIARMRRAGFLSPGKEAKTASGSRLDPAHRKNYQEFFDSSIVVNPRTEIFHPGSRSLRRYGNQLYCLTPDSPTLNGLNVGHWGWWIGTFHENDFNPSPALATGLSRGDAQKVLEFSVDDPDLGQYQRGSPIRIGDIDESSGEWILITVAGFPLGWGKIIKGKIKSYLPNWLRIQ